MKSENLAAQIKCINDSTMHFYQSQCIHITNLEFVGCGNNVVENVANLLVNNATFEGQENSGTALGLIGTTAQIVSSTFVSNRKGGAIIATYSTVDINRSRFEDNRADCGGAIFAEQGSIINMNGNIFVSNNADNSGGAQ